MDGASAVIGIAGGCATALVAIKALHDTIQRYKDRDNTLQKLKNLLEGLVPILDNLKTASNTIESISTLLRGPIDNCAQICMEIKEAVEKFDSKSKPNRRSRLGSSTKMTLIDWGRMEISRGNLSDGIDILEGYKSTIAIGLSIINLGQSRVTEKVVNDFTDVVQTTIRHLQIQLQRIDDKLEDVAASDSEEDHTAALDLENESVVIEQCILLCNEASDYIQSLCAKQAPVLKGSLRGSSREAQDLFESQISTQKALSKSQQTLVEQIGSLTSRLETLQSLDSTDPGREAVRAQLEKDFETSRQCIELCNLASERVSNHKVHIFGDVTADEDCDQVVIASLADMFSVGDASVKKGSMQWVGSVDADVAKQISMDRYRARSTSSASSSPSPQHEYDPSVPRTFGRIPSQREPLRQGRQAADTAPSQGAPSANEVKKRSAGNSLSQE